MMEPPVKDDDGIKIEISEVQICQEWETLAHLNKLVTEAKDCATKALEVTQLSIIPGKILLFVIYLYIIFVCV